MNILLVSQCTKNALAESRRILDQFAERRGDRTWQTAITQAGAATLYRLLRKTARKNTAVACHWVRGQDHSELLWVVGDSRRFDPRGMAPPNVTRRDVLRSGDENDWLCGEDMRLVATLAALFHDLGKANEIFQGKLLQDLPKADPYRHEWVSLRLFEAFVGPACRDDRDWLERLARLAQGNEAETPMLLARLIKEDASKSGAPFSNLRTPLARAVGWLIVSHHRLPTPDTERERDRLSDRRRLELLPAGINHDWCGSRPQEDNKRREACWRFKSLPFDSVHWRQHAGKVAAAILERPGLSQAAVDGLLVSPYVLHLSRLALMLADHYYSSLSSQARYGDPVTPGKTLYANSRRDKDDRGKHQKPQYNQRLDEHLIGVGVNVSRLMRSLPRLAESLPRLARHKGLRERGSGAYRWQNAAFDLAEGLRSEAAEYGFFGVNMASTGCGKTFANARIMYALADPRLGARFSVALGLRTLTLQTGEAYRERLNLGPEDLAVLAGGTANRTLQEHYAAQRRDHGNPGSESADELLPDYHHVHFEGALADGPLRRWLDAGQRGRGGRGMQSRRLLDAPVLVSTIDHLMPASESTRGGHQILPMLRLMTADLVLDEPDDFDVADLPALCRLVHWAGMLGSRVLLSSATLPPALVQGLFRAYCAGRAEFQRYRGRPGRRLDVCCAWFDEFGVHDTRPGADHQGTVFAAHHEAFVTKRVARLAAAKPVRRRADLVDLDFPLPTSGDRAQRLTSIARQLAGLVMHEAEKLHAWHGEVDPLSGKRVSFGLVRMAHIDPLFEVAKALFAGEAPAGFRIHLCPYHSRHPLLIRARIEQVLDAALKRHQPESVFHLPEVRAALDGSEETDHLFIVLATSVAEVGRDHSYHWAIVEPSSMRSLVQLAGRVRRHQEFDCPEEHPNILCLDTNLKSLRQGGQGVAFCHPGFESEAFRLRTHSLRKLLRPEEWPRIDARARIRAHPQPDPANRLVDLEHARLADVMLGAVDGELQREVPAPWWWTTPVHLTGHMQACTPFRADPLGHQTFYLQPDEDCTRTALILLADNGQEAEMETSLLTRLADPDVLVSQRIRPWAVPDYLAELQALAEAFGLAPEDCARRFGTVDLPGRDVRRWRYHPTLGFSRA